MNYNPCANSEISIIYLFYMNLMEKQQIWNQVQTSLKTKIWQI